MALTEQVIIWVALVTPAISVRHLSAQTAAVSVWVETLFLVVRGVKK